MIYAHVVKVKSQIIYELFLLNINKYHVTNLVIKIYIYIII